MLSGLKFIPRDQLDEEKNEDSDDSQKHRKESRRKKKKDRKKKKRSSRYSSSDDDLERVKTGSRKKKKWYASDEDFSSRSDDSSSDCSDVAEKRRTKRKKKQKRKHRHSSDDEGRGSSRIKERSHRKDASSDDYSSEDGGSKSYKESVRKEMGLEWMLRPADSAEKASKTAEIKPEENQAEETRKVNPRELNPYLKDNGSGYPEDSEGTKSSGEQLLSSAVVGDGGASWRLKALKRAKEQAAREGRKLDEVVEERWGSLSQLAVSVACRKAAPTHAHLHAIKSRRRGVMEDENVDKHEEGSVEKGAPPWNPKMRVPKLKDSLSWGERKKQKISSEESEDTHILSSAMSSLNKFADDGSFLSKFMHPPKSDNFGDVVCDSSNSKPEAFNELRPLESKKGSEDTSTVRPALSANQLAAKVMQLRMKGLHDEADKLMKEAEDMKAKQVGNDGNGDESNRLRIDGTTSSYIMHELSSRQKNREDDADLHLAHKIARHQKYDMSSQADDEYDYVNSPRRKNRKKGGGGNSGKSANVSNFANRILTQQERCQFCFENPTRPKHLVVAIANFTYLSLPQWKPIVPGHCCILTMQHESATRSVDDNVWEEIRNFKKCLIMMFAKQEKDVVFLETVMGLAKQRRHCLVECIPLPQDVAKQAPLYFKKAIDEAEDEWSQHNAKKLIDTSIKGLRASIPKDFPYFHVEFGLNRGFVHVIDDEKGFKSSFGLNVVRGILKLPAEDMHSHRKHESMATQKEAVASFARDWVPFNWTKQLD